MGDLTSLNPQGLSSRVQGLLYLYLYHPCFILPQYEVLMKHEVSKTVNIIIVHPWSNFLSAVLVIPTIAPGNLFIYTYSRSFPSYTSASNHKRLIISPKAIPAKVCTVINTSPSGVHSACQVRSFRETVRLVFFFAMT